MAGKTILKGFYYIMDSESVIKQNRMLILVRWWRNENNLRMVKQGLSMSNKCEAVGKIY